MLDPTSLTLRDLCAALTEGALTSEACAQGYLERIEVSNPSLGAYLTVDAEGALAAARVIDLRRRRGQPNGPLAGAPLAIKDNLLTAGLRTTAGSRILHEFVPLHDATAVARLRQAGAVVLGKTNLDEFGMGSSTENSAFRVTRNPWDLTRSPGGSSGGSAAAVAAGLCAGALGTDTGGSIRQPAAFCGIVGLKPTYGRVSRFGAIAFASSLDQIGPMARDVRDTALLYDLIAGSDPFDATTSTREQVAIAGTLSAGLRLDGVRLGLPDEYFPEDGLDPEIASAIDGAVVTLRALGATVVRVSLPHTRHAISTYYLLATAEAASNLARYDGVRFGHRTSRPEDLYALYARSRGEGFGLEVKRRIMLGTFALSAGYQEAYYGKASRVRALIRRDFDSVFERVDALITPTAPTTAFPLGAHIDDPVRMYLADIFTLSCNLAGLPGLSMPCGADSRGLPIGLQLLGRPFDEAGLLRVAAAFEDATPHARRRPLEVR